MQKNESRIANMLRETLISVNVPDSNYEAANVVDALDAIARALGALNGVAEAARSIADALNNVAEAISGKGENENAKRALATHTTNDSNLDSNKNS